MNDGFELNAFVDRTGTPRPSASIDPRRGKTPAYARSPDEHALLVRIAEEAAAESRLAPRPLEAP